MKTDLVVYLANRGRAALLSALALAFSGPAIAGPELSPAPTPSCPVGMTRVSGRPDPAIFAEAASRGVRAHWCEHYDEWGQTTRSGPYWETHADGTLRARATYVRSRIEGPVLSFHESGQIFARGFLEDGDWTGPFEIFHENGAPWFQANMTRGQLDGPVATFFPDGGLESDTRYQAGREDGLARSFFATRHGGRLRSEVHVEADDFVGVQRLLDADGQLVRTIDWNVAPIDWRGLGTGQHAQPEARSRPASPAGP